MRVYAVFRLDPVLGGDIWDAVLSSFLQQPFAAAIQAAALAPHDRLTINRQSLVYGHLMLGDVELDHESVWTALGAAAVAYSIEGTTEEKIAGVIEYEFKAAVVASGYAADLASVLWLGLDEMYAAIASALGWLTTNADLWNGVVLDEWTKPTREAEFVGAQYVQVGPTLYTVATLDDSGATSLRAALEATGEREIHFSVAGNISLNSRIDPPPGFLVDGSDAPNGGVCIQNAAAYESVSIFVYQGNGGALKHLRFRPGLPAGGYNESCKGLVIGQGASNILIDHCSFSWGTDGVTGVGGSSVTFSYCIFSEGLAATAADVKGILVQETAELVAFDHCLFAHFGVRTPKLDTNSDVQMLNCVIYNCISQTVLGGKSYPTFQRADIIGNTWVAGPDSVPTKYEAEHWSDRIGSLLVYAAGNVGPHCTVEQTVEIMTPGDRPFTSFEASALTIPDRAPSSAGVAYLAVLADAGATLPRRDSVDARIVADVVNGTGAIIDDPSEVGGWPNLTE